MNDFARDLLGYLHVTAVASMVAAFLVVAAFLGYLSLDEWKCRRLAARARNAARARLRAKAQVARDDATDRRAELVEPTSVLGGVRSVDGKRLDADGKAVVLIQHRFGGWGRVGRPVSPDKALPPLGDALGNLLADVARAGAVEDLRHVSDAGLVGEACSTFEDQPILGDCPEAL